MAEVFKFKDAMKDGDLFERMIDDLSLSDADLKYKHVSAHYADHTLCGLAWGEYVETFAFKSGRITCPNCLAVIEYCKAFKKGIDY